MFYGNMFVYFAVALLHLSVCGDPAAVLYEMTLVTEILLSAVLPLANCSSQSHKHGQTAAP